MDFGKIAESYDDWYQYPIGKVYDVLEKRGIQEVLPDPYSHPKLLEIGCGTGHWSQFLSAMGYHVTGIDISSNMIQMARSKNIPNSQFQIADGCYLPFADLSYDVGVAITTLEFASDPSEILLEMKRCIRRGGKIIVGVLNRCSILGIKQSLRSKSTYSTAHFYGPNELKRMLEAIGPARIRTSGFLLSWKWFLWSAFITESIGNFLHLPWGDFLIGEVAL